MRDVELLLEPSAAYTLCGRRARQLQKEHDTFRFGYA